MSIMGVNVQMEKNLSISVLLEKKEIDIDCLMMNNNTTTTTMNSSSSNNSSNSTGYGHSRSNSCTGIVNGDTHNYSSDYLLSNAKKTNLVNDKGERIFKRILVASNALPVLVSTSHLGDSPGGIPGEKRDTIRSSGYGAFNPLRNSGCFRGSGGIVRGNNTPQGGGGGGDGTVPTSFSLPNSPPNDQFPNYQVKVTHETSPIESALESLVDNEIKDYLWIGWPHCEVTEDNVDQVESEIKKAGSNLFPIFLDETNVDNYYKGYCKIGLWPLIHYQLNFVRLETQWWDSYVQVNQLFCDKIVELYRPGDVIWVHDYHLMLLPAMVKKALGNKVSIGFFFHAPFPSYELFRILPNRTELLQGILGSNLIGFQSFEYLRHFKSSCARLLDLQVDPKGIEVIGENVSPHFVKLQVYPIGVDFSDYASYLETPSVLERIQKLREIFKDKKVIFARDKLDSIEGVPRKLQVLENLLENYPEWREKLVLIQIYEPVMEQYSESSEQKTFHKSVNEMVGRINGKYGTLNYNPIEYINRKVGIEELTALYRLADMALITPLRDGMNLTSHEYVVCQKDSFGVLVLSEFTGAARCLGGAIIVNPFSEKEITMSVIEALNMPMEERRLKHSINYNYVMANTSHFWAKRYLCDLYETVKDDPTTTMVPQINPDMIKKCYVAANMRHFFLDYDGTLTPLVKHPKMAAPTKELLDTLERLTKDPRNQVAGVIEQEENGQNDKIMQQRILENEQKLKGVGLKCFTVKVLAEGGKDQLNTYAKSLIDSPLDVVHLLNTLSKLNI
ncbi:glycosyltransferase [Cavenderia fasciculata]|uniref:Glycosyltransferase n=1 Tax=Cavenderia fasciculata TaxID=261658 RepID=F4PGG1_CACFS|nr:glycosyltransferase [Cavenderia fasciculata]EGG24795.1 glycosyltransferase [Cavenderia fasciculata]|eukprot:XP_004362646.1 glycosyltransferase [Cavenderia fasciculata]